MSEQAKQLICKIFYPTYIRTTMPPALSTTGGSISGGAAKGKKKKPSAKGKKKKKPSTKGKKKKSKKTSGKAKKPAAEKTFEQVKKEARSLKVPLSRNGKTRTKDQLMRAVAYVKRT
jgi:hypothetical protein